MMMINDVNTMTTDLRSRGQKTILSMSKLVKVPAARYVFESLNPQKSISRKIWVTEKSLNFHTVESRKFYKHWIFFDS